MTGASPRARRKHGLSAQTTRLRQFPGRDKVFRFCAELRHRTRVSAVRSVVDGLIVAKTMKKKGVRSLLRAAGAPPAHLDPKLSVEVSRAVDAGLGVLPIAPTCLRRSVTLLRELNRLHLTATMHIGVRSIAGVLEAHAWVQAGDVVVNDDPEVTKTYVELAAGDLERILPLLP